MKNSNIKKNMDVYLIKRKIEETDKEIPKKVKMEVVNPTKSFPIIKIISGGQTGADFGALEAAEFVGIETGGTAAQDYWTTDGKCPELGSRFHLKELVVEKKTKISLSAMYIKRSMINVDDSDATIAFRLYSSPGTDKTIGYCLTKKWGIIDNYAIFGKPKYRPLLVIDDVSDEKKESNIQKIRSFIYDNNVKILNVCGHREDKKVGSKNFQKAVRDLLICSFFSEIEANLKFLS